MLLVESLGLFGHVLLVATMFSSWIEIDVSLPPQNTKTRVFFFSWLVSCQGDEATPPGYLVERGGGELSIPFPGFSLNLQVKIQNGGVQGSKWTCTGGGGSGDPSGATIRYVMFLHLFCLVEKGEPEEKNIFGHFLKFHRKFLSLCTGHPPPFGGISPPFSYGPFYGALWQPGHSAALQVILMIFNAVTTHRCVVEVLLNLDTFRCIYSCAHSWQPFP